MDNRKLYQRFASLIQSLDWLFRQGRQGEAIYRDKKDEIDRLAKAYMPSGSGFDCGTALDWGKQARTDGEGFHTEKLYFTTEFHHMNDAGYYDGWTTHRIIVTPSFTSEINLVVGGRDRNGIKEYIHEVFSHALT